MYPLRHSSIEKQTSEHGKGNSVDSDGAACRFKAPPLGSHKIWEDLMRIFLGLAAILALLNFGCATKPTLKVETNRRSLVLIHGSHFDATAWDLVKPELKGDYDIFAVSLLGRTEEEHANLTEMAQDICAKITSPAAIVAHSFGGVVVNQMVGICPAKINRIIYVAAIVPLNGEKAFASMDQKSQRTYERAVLFEKSRIAPREAAVFLKVMDESLDPKKLPKVKLFSESYGPGQDTIAYEGLAFDKIPKYYIYTSLDKIVSAETQKKFTGRTPMIKTETVVSGHLPMLSKPKDLAAAIRKLL